MQVHGAIYAAPSSAQEGVLGALRFLFALIAVFGLSSPDVSFFGYEGLMGLVMLEGYRSTAMVDRYYSRYLPRRAWRLYVLQVFRKIVAPYWLFMLVGLAVAYGCSTGAKAVASYYYSLRPDQWARPIIWLPDLFLIPQVNLQGTVPRHSFHPLSWWVAMMFIWSLLGPVLVLFRDMRRLVILFVGYYSVVLCGAMLAGSQYMDWFGLAMRGLFSGAFPFLVGVTVYCKQQQVSVENRIQRGAYYVWLFFVLFQWQMFADVTVQGYYMFIVFSGLLLYQSDMEGLQRASFWWRNLCYFLGRIAYPMVLLCGPVMAVILQIFPQSMQADAIETVNMRYFWPPTVTLATLAVAILIRMFVLFPAEKLLIRQPASLRQ